MSILKSFEPPQRKTLYTYLLVLLFLCPGTTELPWIVAMEADPNSQLLSRILPAMKGLIKIQILGSAKSLHALDSWVKNMLTRTVRERADDVSKQTCL